MSKRLYQYAKGIRRYFILAFILALVSVGSVLLMPIVIGKAIDALVVGAVETEKVMTYLVWLSALTINYFLSRFLMEIFVNIGTQKLVTNLRNDTVKHVLSAPIKEVDQMQDGALMQTVIADIEAVKEGLLQTFNQLFSGVFTIIGILVIMFYYQPILAILVVVLTPLSLVFAAVISKRGYASLKASVDSRHILASYAEEMIFHHDVLKALNHEKRANQQFAEYSETYRKDGFKAVMYASLVNPTTRLINTIIYLSVGVLGSWLLIKDFSEAFTVGVFSTFLTYAYQYTKPFNEISAVYAQLQQALHALRRVFYIIDIEPNQNGTVKLDHVSGHIEFRDVSFGYQENKYILKNIDIDIKPGEKIAVVGSTGSGKTTLINLLMRFYPSYMGKILVDGVDILSMDKENLRLHVGMVLQESWLFEGTVFDNIRYGKEDATDEEVIEAAKKVYADDFIRKLKHGYETMLHNDQSVSLGEKQLLAIARVMLLNPPILILDEATSNIDALTEIKVQKAFDELMRHKTSIVIAHRLQTIMKSDRIMVLKDGKIIEVGSHDALLAQKGEYAKIYESQFVKKD